MFVSFLFFLALGVFCILPMYLDVTCLLGIFNKISLACKKRLSRFS